MNFPVGFVFRENLQKKIGAAWERKTRANEEDNTTRFEKIKKRRREQRNIKIKRSGVSGKRKTKDQDSRKRTVSKYVGGLG